MKRKLKQCTFGLHVLNAQNTSSPVGEPRYKWLTNINTCDQCLMNLQTCLRWIKWQLKQNSWSIKYQSINHMEACPLLYIPGCTMLQCSLYWIMVQSCWVPGNSVLLTLSNTGLAKFSLEWGSLPQQPQYYLELPTPETMDSCTQTMVLFVRNK